jgi:DUF4097 and DUF4098 domain-containing protein YvlB
MLKKTLAVRPSFKIVLTSAPGDLRLTGWDRDEVSAKTDGDVLDLVLNGETVTISCDDDLILNVPRVMAVQVEHAEGDVEVRTLAGALSFGAVSGDLSLREVGALSIGSVEGDLTLRGCTGGCSAGELNSDASIREVRGNISLNSVSGDLFVRGVTGNLHARVEDDVVLYLEPLDGTAIDVISEGDILLHIPTKTNASMSLTADDPDDINVQIPGAQVTGGNPRSVILGNGGSAAISLKAEGDILVTSESKDWESAAEFDFGSNWPLPEDFNERINRTVERATRQAEAATRRAEQRVRQQTRRFAFNWAPGRGVPTPPTEPVSDEERMAILRMLQEKKISAEDAEKLLSALEGGD